MRSSTWLLLVLVACVMVGNGLIVPVLPIYGAELSASSTLVGMLVTIFGVTRLAANFPAGALFRRIGPRALLVVGSALLMLGAVGAALSENSLTLLLVWRGVQGVGSGVFLTTVGVLVALRSVAGRRGRMLASYQTAIFVGAGIGPTIGGYLAGAFGVSAPFWAYALAAAVALVAAVLYVHPSTIDTATVPARVPLRRTLWHPQYVANLAMSFSAGFVRTAALWQLVPLVAATHHGMSLALIGIAVTVTSLANVAVLPISGRLVDRLGWRVPPWVAAIVQALALATVGLSASTVAFWVAITVIGITGGFIGPALATSMVEITPTAALGSATGLQRTVGDAGFVLGPVVVGGLMDLAGLTDAGAMLLVAGLVVVSAVWWFVTVQGTRRALPV